MLFDLFLYNGEKEILNLRLNILNDIVDYFVILESCQTKQNTDKPYYFEEQRKEFANWNKRIIYLKVGPLGFKGHYNDFYLRNSFYPIVKSVSNSDYLMLSDLDEIPHPDQIKRYCGKLDEPICFQQINFSYKFNLIKPGIWYGTILFQKKYLLGYEKVRTKLDLSHPTIGFQKLRELRSQLVQIPNGGWHYSYCMTPEEIYRKLNSFGHPEFKISIEEIKKRINDRIAVGDSSSLVRLDPRDFNDINCPKYVLDNLVKYKHLLLK